MRNVRTLDVREGDDRLAIARDTFHGDVQRRDISTSRKLELNPGAFVRGRGRSFHGLDLASDKRERGEKNAGDCKRTMDHGHLLLLTPVRVDRPPSNLRAPSRLRTRVHRIGLSAALVHDAPALRTIFHARLGPFHRLKGPIVQAIGPAFVGILRHFILGAERRPTCIGVANGIGNGARRAVRFEQRRTITRTGIGDQFPRISRIVCRWIAPTREFGDQMIHNSAVTIGIPRIQIVSVAIRADKPSGGNVEVRAIRIARGEGFSGPRFARAISTCWRIAAIRFAARARFSRLAEIIAAGGPHRIGSGVTIRFACDSSVHSCVIAFPRFATAVSAKVIFVVGVVRTVFAIPGTCDLRFRAAA